MDSLPLQPIDSLPTVARSEAYEKLALLCLARSRGIDSQEELQEKTGFPSIEAMQISLKNWGLSSLLPSAEKQPQENQEPKARSAGGEKQTLPPLTNTATTFKDTIATLEVYLEQVLSLRESLQGHYFIGEGETSEANIREARGMQWHPHSYLVVLIAVSILEHGGNWGYVERLLRELHPSPAKANRQQLVRFIYGKKVDDRGRPILNKDGRPVDYGDGLLDRARQIAALIRGKQKIGRGRKGPPIPSYDQLMALYMRSLVDRGSSREQVLQNFRDDFERWKEEHLRSLREELEIVTASPDQTEVQEYEREIRHTEGEEFDEDEFNRVWDLSRDLR